MENDRFLLLLGTDFGYARVNTDIGAEFDKNGYQLNIKGIASYEWTDWTVDGGAGWMYQYLTGSNPPVASETITTRAAMIELAGRYRISDRWQGGLITRSIFGTDLNFGSRLNLTNFGQFAGVQGVYEIPLSKILLRLSVQALTDLSIDNRQIYMLEGGLQVGFHPSWKNDSTKPSQTEKEDAVSIDLEAGEVYFEFKSSTLTSDANKYLERVGQFLSSHQKLWRELHIDGHTDQRGPDDFNLSLSQARANAVKAALVSGGAPEAKLTATGYGYRRPRREGRGESVWRENRRVELIFNGVSDPLKFREELQKLRP